ncbi:MAG: ISAs1 family transposase [Erysipelotrichales bacterium]|nr:ISAs1 family transposase [Erysipelotrichales bacterium]
MKKYIEKITDPRQQGKTKYNLHEIITMTICAVMSGCEIWEEIIDFCKVKENWFCNELKLTLANGIASHDTFQRIFQIIKPDEFEKCFVEWVKSIKTNAEKEYISIDGKTVCGSKKDGKDGIHLVGAWASKNQLALGQIKVDGKTNEIKAIPKLLDLLELSNSVITIDAMGCQKDIAEKIIKDAESDYVLALKGNQGNLYNDVKLYFDEEKIKESYTTNEKDHGRIETREYYLETEINWLDKKSEWLGIKGIGMVRSKVIKKDKVPIEKRYFLTSLEDVESFAKSVRGHWGVENSLHWCLDVIFNEDSNRTRKDNSAENFSVIRRMALNALRKHPSKMSLNRKKRKCHYDVSFMAEVLFSVF